MCLCINIIFNLAIKQENIYAVLCGAVPCSERNMKIQFVDSAYAHQNKTPKKFNTTAHISVKPGKWLLATFFSSNGWNDTIAEKKKLKRISQKVMSQVVLFLKRATVVASENGNGGDDDNVVGADE